MSESKTPSDPDKLPKPENGSTPKPLSESAQKTPASGKEGAAVAPAGSKPEGKPARGLIAFVGRLRKSTRKTRAAAIATRQAEAVAAKKAADAARAARIEARKNPPDPNKPAEPSFQRANADEVVKPIRPEDLREGAVPGELSKDASKKAEPGAGGEPGRLSIEKVERLGTRSERKPQAKAPVRDEKAEKRRRSIVTGFKVGLALIFFVVAAILVFLSLRETRIKLAINTSSAFEVDPEVWVVTDFQERIDLIKRDLQRREEPLRKEVSGIDQDLSAAKADYAGRSQRKKLLLDAMNKDKAEIPVIMEGTQKSLDKLWKEDADNLDAEYERKKDAFNKEIGARAKQLNLAQYSPSEELDAPEVAVNAFRLALYSAPDGVETGKEREWAENRLKNWRKFEEDWSDRQMKIKQEADALRQTIQPEIDEVKGRVVVKQEEIAAVDVEIEEFAKEVSRHEEKMKESSDRLGAVAQPFYEDLLKAPNDYVQARWTLEKLGLLDVRNLDRDPLFPPGEYRLFVRAKKKGAVYWAQKTFLVNKYKTTKITLSDDDFFPVKSLLENK